MEIPSFTPYFTVDRLEYYVLASWPDGATARINYFETLEEAQGWIVREAGNWLEFRAQTRLLEGTEAIVAREVTQQYLQAA